MSDLISRDALLCVPHVCKVTEYDETGCGITYLAVPVDAIKAAPTIDAVPVVRCKECKYRDTDLCPMCYEAYTYNEDDGADYYTVDNTTHDGYCHMGRAAGGGVIDDV